MIIQLSKEVEQVLEILMSQGHEAYAVGGCVRDRLLGKTPKDWDVCTSALPSEVAACFENERIVETGLKHGTLTVLVNQGITKIPVEVTTFRIDGEYLDCRRPESVSFTKSLYEDLSRRDFTVNAFAYNEKSGLIDFFEGMKDLQDRKIKCVGQPSQRFGEDGLRVIRALRFASVLGFSIDQQTEESVFRQSGLLNHISAERISSEFNKLLLGDGAVPILRKYAKVFCTFIPELEAIFDFEQNSRFHHLDVWAHTLSAVENTPKDLVIRLTMLLHDLGKPLCSSKGHFYGHAQLGAKMAVSILRRLKYDNHTIHQVEKLVMFHDSDISPTLKGVRRWLNKLGETTFRQLLHVKRADIYAHHPDYLFEIREIDHLESLCNEIIDAGLCYSLKDLAVKGEDLMQAGFKEGKDLGLLLHKLLDQVIEDEVANEKEALLKICKEGV